MQVENNSKWKNNQQSFKYLATFDTFLFLPEFMGLTLTKLFPA